VDVTVPVAGGRKRRDGIRIHRIPSLPRSATTSRLRIPVTTPARTLADIRPQLSPGGFRSAARQADFLRLPVDFERLVPDRSATELERLFLRLCHRRRLPLPEVNVWIGRHRVDFLWREQRVVVETDGYESHRGRQAFEDDRARDNELMAAGYDVLRFTYRRVVDEPEHVAAVIRARLDRSSTP
jgi:very-short-patch-repair endonuclease